MIEPAGLDEPLALQLEVFEAEVVPDLSVLVTNVSEASCVTLATPDLVEVPVEVVEEVLLAADIPDLPVEATTVVLDACDADAMPLSDFVPVPEVELV